ncbi:MAG: hypothetical protein CSB49_03550 [Proteobacteria bacterium]|nr:MAG: hypothetical protein CSB49_03550 [Pseudomonadota bacterium]
MFRVHWAALLAGALMFSVVGCSDDDKATPDQAVPDTGVDTAPSPDVGKPDLSEDKKLKITAIVPDNGPACPYKEGGAEGNCDGTIPVTLIGQNFDTGAAVFVEGGSAYLIDIVDVSSAATLQFRLPKQPYDTAKPVKVFISVRVGDQQSNAVGFQYWVTKPATSDYIGSVVTKTIEAFRDFSSETITGKVKIVGKTDTTSGKAVNGLRVQFGISVKGKDPLKSYTWRWFDATYKADDGDYDTYEGKVTPWLDGEFDLAMRFSDDNGATWTFVDTDETDPAYDGTKVAVLTVSSAPQLYCQKDDDCKLNLLEKVCKLNPTDWKKHLCVSCLNDQDCKNNPSAFGPNCDTTKERCFCKSDDECKTHENGKKCIGNTYCGCKQPTDCVEPNVCYKDNYLGQPVQGAFGCGPPQE